jgi:hypothetical protein
MNQLIKYLPLPGAAAGLEESLPLEPLPITGRRKFIDLLVEGRTPEIVALSFRQNLGWIDSLADDCYNRLCAECIRLNFSKAMEMTMSDPIAGLKVGPLMLQLGQTLKLLDGLSSSPMPSVAWPGGTASPTMPPPTAAAAPTPSASATTPPPPSGAT